MADAECKSQIVKRAKLFSALTGFRFSDIQTLVWDEIRGSEGNYFIFYEQEKTEITEYFPASDQAIALLGKRGDPKDKVFKGLKYSDVDTMLPDWLMNAGINRHFPLHGFRNNFTALNIV